MNDAIEKLKDSLPELTKDNKGAIAGAIIGYLFADDPKIQAAILGAIAGSVVIDKKREEDNDTI